MQSGEVSIYTETTCLTVKTKQRVGTGVICFLWRFSLIVWLWLNFQTWSNVLLQGSCLASSRGTHLFGSNLDFSSFHQALDEIPLQHCFCIAAFTLVREGFLSLSNHQLGDYALGAVVTQHMLALQEYRFVLPQCCEADHALELFAGWRIRSIFLNSHVATHIVQLVWIFIRNGNQLRGSS